MSASSLFLPGPSEPDTWLAYDHALTLCQRTPQWFSQQIRKGRVEVREAGRKLHNGRFAREIALRTLPEAARLRFAQQQAALAPTGQQAELPLFGGPQLVGRRPRVKVPHAKMPEAARKQHILEPILAMGHGHARRMYADRLQLADGTPVTSQQRMIRYQVEQASQRGESLTERTIKRWLAAHKKEGVAGLAKHQRSDAGRSRFFDRPENRKAAALVAYLYLGDGLTPGLSAQACFDMLRVQRELVELAEKDLPHYHTVRLFLARITPALKTFALRGRKEFAERMLPYLSRGYQEHANQIWVSDTMIADVECLNDCILGAPTGAPIRLRLTAIIDFRSRYVVGYSWAWEGSSASIGTALRHAIAEHGLPQLCYFDNGKDYCKVAKGAVPGYLRPGSVEAEDWAEREVQTIENTGVLARLGVQVTHCLAHHPQSKHVERFFRTVHLTFCKLWATYTGGKPSERPDQTTALMAVHRRAVRKGDLSLSRHPLASEFIAAFKAWLPTYHSHEQDGQGMSGRTPAEVFAAERGTEQRPAPSADELVWLLSEQTVAKVRECQVRVNKHDYAAEENPVAARLMLDRNETRVAIAYDPLDPAEIAVLDDDGHLVCVLRAKRLAAMAPHDPETQRQVAAMQQQRGQLVRELKEDRTSVIRAGKQLGVVHPLQMLAAASDEHQAAHIVPRKPRLPETASQTRAPQYAHQLAASIAAMKKGGR